MVSKSEIRSPTMVVANYLKRASSDEYATTPESEVHNSKKAREETTNMSTILQKRNNRNNNLSVTFSSKNDVFEITRPTREEKNHMHMSKEDQKLILLEISNAIRRLYDNELQQHEGVHDDNSDERCIADLGLERILEQQNSKRMGRVKSAISVILQRQRQSKLFNSSRKQTLIINEGWLMKHYQHFSKQSANLARSRGLQDQEMAPYLFPRKIVMSR